MALRSGVRRKTVHMQGQLSTKAVMHIHGLSHQIASILCLDSGVRYPNEVRPEMFTLACRL